MSAVPVSAHGSAGGAAATLLAVRGLRKRFGGVVATDDVTLAVAEGEVHALIGPNGAGKTSLIAQLSGTPPFKGRRDREVLAPERALELH